MFFNKIGAKSYDSEVIDPQHQYFTAANHLVPVFIFIAVFLGKTPCAAAGRYLSGKFSFIVDYEKSKKMQEE